MSEEPEHEQPAADEPDERFPIAAIGGSAGSLEALNAFLDALDSPPGMAFVVVTHQQPGRTSLLPELLGKQSRLPVVHAEEGTTVEPDHVYVALPDGELTIADGVLHRVEPEADLPAHHPVDRFFRALAGDARDAAVGIVLSGSGSDGALGVRAIKAEAGLVIVQSPDSATFSSMPESALATELADQVLAPDSMPEALLSYARAWRRMPGPADDEAVPAALEGKNLSGIFNLLRRHTGQDLSSYKRSTVDRRIARRMRVHQIETLGAYERYLHDNPQELDLLLRELLISVTSFFRDRGAWDALAESGLADRLHAAAREGREFRAWVVGCATGEEAYTLAIVLAELRERFAAWPPIQIFATDVDASAVEVGRGGLYSSGIAEDVPRSLLEKYFIEEGSQYRVKKALREHIVFAVQNVIQDPPFTRLDLVSCRNLLIYLQPSRQKQLLPKLHYALQPGGLLFLGGSESVGEPGGLFDTVDQRSKIFRRSEQASTQYSLVDVAGGVPSPERPGVPARYAGNADRAPDFARLVERILAGRFAPPTVVVNGSGRIVYVHGRTGRFLEPTSGVPDHDVLDMAREGLRASLSEALRRVIDDRDGTVRTSARVRSNGGSEPIDLEVRRIDRPEALRGLRMVSFLASGAEPPAGGETAPSTGPVMDLESAGSGDGHARVAELEEELRAARADYQATVEELEASNEELQSTNEELQSTNEELQSSNEELETSKEEMESLNEELQTVNNELEAKVQDLAQVNDDMQNLLNSTRIATIFLDDGFRIRRYTEEAKRLIALRPSDVGRPIGELQSHLRYDGLLDDGRQVMEDLQSVEREVQDRDGHWYLLRLVPYRTTENVIDGLVCTFVDIEPVKVQHRRMEFFRSIVETVRQPIVVVDAGYYVVMANAWFYTLFDTIPERIEGLALSDIVRGRWDDAALHRLLAEILPRNESFEDFPMTVRFPSGEEREVSLNARRLGQSDVDDPMILLAIEANPVPMGEGEGGDGPNG